MFQSGFSSQSGGGVFGLFVGCDDDWERLAFEFCEAEAGGGFGEPAADRISSFDGFSASLEELLPGLVEAKRWPWKPGLEAIRYCQPMLTSRRL